MTKLLNSDRDKILSDLLVHRFGVEAYDLSERASLLAQDVYEDVYSQGERDQMAVAPNGMLDEDTSVNVRFGDGNYTRLPFHGGDNYYFRREPSVLRLVENITDLNPNTRRVWASRRGIAKVYELSHPLAVQNDQLQRDIASLAERIGEAGHQISGALTKVTTVENLLREWPEVKPFIPPRVAPPPPLPAIPVATLNDLLDLPVEACDANSV